MNQRIRNRWTALSLQAWPWAAFRSQRPPLAAAASTRSQANTDAIYEAGYRARSFKRRATRRSERNPERNPRPIHPQFDGRAFPARRLPRGRASCTASVRSSDPQHLPQTFLKHETNRTRTTRRPLLQKAHFPSSFPVPPVRPPTASTEASTGSRRRLLIPAPRRNPRESMAVYLFQGPASRDSPPAHVRLRIHFGLSFGWKPYDSDTNPWHYAW